MKRIGSNEYFDVVKEYFADHKVPSRVYKFLLDMLMEDEYKLSNDLLNRVLIRLKLQKTAFVSALARSIFLCCVQSEKIR